MGKYFKNHYSKITSVPNTQSSIKLDSVTANASFRVVAVTNKLTSLPSNVVLFSEPVIQSIPGKVEAKYATKLHGILLEKRSAKKDRPERIQLSKFLDGYQQPNNTATFKVNVKESGVYQFNYAGSSAQSGTFFKLWSGHQLLGDINYDPDVDDKSSNRYQVYLEKGQHDLQITIQREGFDWWTLNWLKFTKR